MKVKANNFSTYGENCYGNYLIRNKNENWSHTGESNNPSKRIRQHLREKSLYFLKIIINQTN
ncbi:GIY-YIG nuclease family protein [Profundicola chukchiensis]|uniref:GIY-YIG nuclease family protein n=1 Tax=Profundicola chukchiensis TaxID=2961959 RepID=UPI0034E1E9ED